MDYVAQVCEENQIPYCLIGGSALGAVRHQGFIPWDDDLDIGVLREDYDRLLNILRNANHPLYVLQNEDTEPGYFLSFSKVRKNGTVFRESIAPDAYNHNGIYIDIFPIDTTDRIDSLRCKLIGSWTLYISHVLRVRNCSAFYRNKGKLKYFCEQLLCLPLKPFPNRALLKHQANIMQKNNRREKNYAVMFSDTYHWKVGALPYDVYFPVKKVAFEDREYAVCGQVGKYLSQVYGNYMELPPVEKRHTHEPLELKF